MGITGDRGGIGHLKRLSTHNTVVLALNISPLCRKTMMVFKPQGKRGKHPQNQTLPFSTRIDLMLEIYNSQGGRDMTMPCRLWSNTTCKVNTWMKNRNLFVEGGDYWT